MSNIFVSYSRVDKIKVVSIVEDMESLGHKIWFDDALTGGQNWWDQIIENIQKADVFVFILSPASLGSQACRSEYEYADNLDKIILPIFVTSGFSVNLLPPALAKIQMVDYLKSDKDSAFRLVRALNSFSEFKELPEIMPEPPKAPLSFLGNLLHEIESQSTLNTQQQNAFLQDIKSYLKQANVNHNDALIIINVFKMRSDINADILVQLDSLLDNLQFDEEPDRFKGKMIPDSFEFTGDKNPTSKIIYRVVTAILLTIICVFGFNKYKSNKGYNELVSRLNKEKLEYDKFMDVRFSSGKDGVIVDSKTKLIWKKCSEGQSGLDCEKGEAQLYSWYDVNELFPNLDSTNSEGWRLPTKTELMSLVYCSNGPPDELSSQCDDKYNQELFSPYDIPESLLTYIQPTIFTNKFPHSKNIYWSFDDTIMDVESQMTQFNRKINMPVIFEKKITGASIDFTAGKFDINADPNKVMFIRLVRSNLD